MAADATTSLRIASNSIEVEVYKLVVSNFKYQYFSRALSVAASISTAESIALESNRIEALSLIAPRRRSHQPKAEEKSF